MTSPRVVVYGASDFSRVVTSLIQLATDFEIAGYLDDDPSRAGESFLDATILGGPETLESLKASGIHHAVIGFGDCRGRLQVGAVIESAGMECLTLIHPAAVVPDQASLGPGALVMAGAVIDPYVSIGPNAIINKNCAIGHDTTIGAAAHLASGVTVGGGCAIGDAALVGTGATVMRHAKIGAHAVVGAAALVRSDIPDHAVAWGVPAVVQKSKQPET